MKSLFVTLAMSLAIIGCTGCDNNQAQDIIASGESSEAGHAEGQHGAEDEESSVQYAKDDNYDQVRGGARLVLSYDSTKESFIGSVENTTNAVLNRVRVEVHLSNGVELGPTNPQNLKPNEKIVIELSASGQDFLTWSAHAEVG